MTIKPMWNRTGAIKAELLTITVVMVLCACASQSAMVANSAKIRAGMSTKQLVKTMGQPQNRQFNGKSEAWQYCSTDYTGFESDHYFLFWITNGTVTGMQTYQNSEIGTCESFFRMVDWDEAPDSSDEIRRKQQIKTINTQDEVTGQKI